MPSISGFLTGRCVASKARPDYKSGKVSADLDTPTDLPQAAVDVPPKFASAAPRLKGSSGSDGRGVGLRDEAPSEEHPSQQAILANQRMVKYAGDVKYDKGHQYT